MIKQAPISFALFIIMGILLGWIANSIIMGERVLIAEARAELQEERAVFTQEQLDAFKAALGNSEPGHVEVRSDDAEAVAELTAAFEGTGWTVDPAPDATGGQASVVIDASEPGQITALENALAAGGIDFEPRSGQLWIDYVNASAE